MTDTAHRHFLDTHRHLAALLDRMPSGCDPDFDDGGDELERQFAEIRRHLPAFAVEFAHRARGHQRVVGDECRGKILSSRKGKQRADGVGPIDTLAILQFDCVPRIEAQPDKPVRNASRDAEGYRPQRAGTEARRLP